MKILRLAMKLLEVARMKTFQSHEALYSAAIDTHLEIGCNYEYWIDCYNAAIFKMHNIEPTTHAFISNLIPTKLN
jgi:hypothetical protein